MICLFVCSSSALLIRLYSFELSCVYDLYEFELWNNEKGKEQRARNANALLFVLHTSVEKVLIDDSVRSSVTFKVIGKHSDCFALY